MYIKLINDRICGRSEIIDNIDVNINEEFIDININVHNFELNENDFLDEIEFGNYRAFKDFSSKIYKNFKISVQELEQMFLDFGVITFCYNYTFTEFKLINVTPITTLDKKNLIQYHEDLGLISMIWIFSPYKGCKLEDCSIVIRHLSNIPVVSNFIYSKQISNLSDFIYKDFAWGENNYPKIICSNSAKIGEKFYFDVETPNNNPIYLQANIGILNKNRITTNTSVEVNLTDIQDNNEDLEIKLSYKYWTAIVEKKINLIY